MGGAKRRDAALLPISVCAPCFIQVMNVIAIPPRKARSIPAGVKLDAYDDCAALVPNHSLSPIGTINTNFTINSEHPVNVIELGSINLAGGKVVTLSGAAGDQFIFQVSGSIKLSHKMSEIKVVGVSPDDVTFCFSTTGDALRISGGANVVGNYLAPHGNVILSPGHVEGRAIAGGEICMPSGGQIAPPPEDECNILTGPFPACCSEFTQLQCIQAGASECLAQCF